MFPRYVVRNGNRATQRRGLKVGENKKTAKALTDLANRMVLTGMIRSACEVADLGLYNAADNITHEVGVAAERMGYDVEELFAPLWGDVNLSTTQAAAA
jgi:hypothetical protein